MMTLSRIGTAAAREIMALEGLAWEAKRLADAKQIMADYCWAVRAAFGISLRPVIRYDEITHHLTVDAKPASEYDALLLDRLMQKEGLV